MITCDRCVEAEADRDTARQAAEAARAEVARLKTWVDNHLNEVTDVRGQLAEAQAEVARLRTGPCCPTCADPLAANAAIRSALRDAETANDNCQRRIVVLEAEVARFKAHAVALDREKFEALHAENEAEVALATARREADEARQLLDIHPILQQRDAARARAEKAEREADEWQMEARRFEKARTEALMDLKRVSENRAELVDAVTAERERAEKAEAKLHRLAADALAHLAGAGIATPVEGYEKAPHCLSDNIDRLARERDEARDAVQAACDVAVTEACKAIEAARDALRAEREALRTEATNAHSRLAGENRELRAELEAEQEKNRSLWAVLADLANGGGLGSDEAREVMRALGLKR